jgi:hypothetical protein
MADEKVSIVVKVITKTKQLDALIAKLRAAEAMESRLSSGKNVQKYANATSAALNRATGKWKKHFDFVDSVIRGFGKVLTKFLTTAIKGVIIEMGILAATMLAWHALVIAGQYAVKAYRGVMQLLAGGAAAFTVALAGASAAIREQQAAMYAYRGKGASQYKTSMNQTVMAMRNLQMNADLASLGVEALNGAFASMSKTMNVSQINASSKSLKALMDFGAAGQDPKKAAAQVGTVVAALEDEKKTISNVLSEAKKLGPEMEKALKDTKIKTKKEFKELLFSGELAKKGGVLGQFEAVNTTLISELTRYFTLLRGQFADFGMQFLKPGKEAFQRLFEIISRDMQRILLTVQAQFGSEGMIKGFVDGVEKVSNWMVKTIRQYLPGFQGMFKRLGEWMSNFKRGWNIIIEKLRPLIDGARVVEKSFGQIWLAIKDGVENMTRFRELLMGNEDTVVQFGTKIGDLIRDASDLLFKMKGVFFEILPFLNDVLSGIGMLIRGMTQLLTGFGGGNGGFMRALAPLLAFQIFGRRMMGAAGKMMPMGTGIGRSLPFSNLQNMPIQAQNVYVNGNQVAGGSPQISSPAASSGRLSSGGYPAAPMAPYPALGPGAPGGALPVYGPAISNLMHYRGPFLSRIYGVSSGSQLSDFAEKQNVMGGRMMSSTFQQADARQYGGGIAISSGQFTPGAQSIRATMMMDPATGLPFTRQIVSDTDAIKTQAITDTSVIGKDSRGQNNRGAAVYRDTRHLGGVYVNERGIPLTFSQNNQSSFSRLLVDDRMRLSEAMQVGRLAKQGFAKGDRFRAGMDQRAFERREILNAGYGATPLTGVHTPGGPAATPGRPSLGVSKGADVDYSRMGDKRLRRLARARGLDASGSNADIVRLLQKNDRDRMLAAEAVKVQGTPQQARYEAQMSHAFKYGPAYKRYFKDVTTTAPDGTKTTQKIMRDPGLTARESLTKAAMRARGRLQDVGAYVGNKFAGVAGSAQGVMAYANSGRFDPTLNDGKGDFVNVTKMRQEALQRMKDQREQQNRGRFTTRLSYMREMMRISRSETKFGAASKRFAQSGTGRMGTSMGLSLASQYAPEEMRGAMALGGMVSMIDPRLGLAVAGVGGALKARSAGTGAAAGLVGGAAVGQYFGPYGAAIGAGIGTLVGAISGAVNKGKYELKEAKEAAEFALFSLFTGISERASRTFTVTREMQEKGIDISRRKRAFQGFGAKFIAARANVADKLRDVAGITAQDLVDADRKGMEFSSIPSYDATPAEWKAASDEYYKGSSKKRTAEKKVGKTASETLQYAFDNQTRLGISISEEQLKDMKKRPEESLQGLIGRAEQHDKVMTMLDNIGDARFAQLAKDTGKSEAELELLAQELGVDLYNATVKYKDIAVKMGAALILTSGQMNNAITDLMLQTGDKFRKKREQREAQKAINFATTELRDKYLSPGATDEEKDIASDAYFENYAAQQIAATGGDAFAAYEAARMGFGSIDKKTGKFVGGTAFAEGGSLSGLGGTDAQIKGVQTADEMRNAIAKTYSQQLAAMAQASGYSIDAGVLQKQIENMDDAKLKTLSTSIMSEGFDFRDSATGETTQGSIEAVLKRLNFSTTMPGRLTSLVDPLEENALDPFVGDMEAIATKFGIDYEIFKGAVNNYKLVTEKFFTGDSGAPDWWKKGLKATNQGGTFRLLPDDGGDTATPRGGQMGDTTTSRLSQTMARHQAINAQLTGKRQITSAWRNHNLGSVNSDHVTGRAYDLKGQNLGQYAKLIHANGGFAEFHGNLASRHLHVVPGPVPGVGDTPVPANNGGASSPMNYSTGPANYTININGANASPEAIASMVMAKLDDRERQYRER